MLALSTAHPEADLGLLLFSGRASSRWQNESSSPPGWIPVSRPYKHLWKPESQSSREGTETSHQGSDMSASRFRVRLDHAKDVLLSRTTKGMTSGTRLKPSGLVFRMLPQP